MSDLEIPAVTANFPVNDRDLERVLCGEAPADVVARVTALAGQHPRLAAHLAERRAERAAFALLHPRAPAVTHVETSNGTSWLARMTARSTWLSAGFAAACIVAFVVIPAPTDGPHDGVRSKGRAVPDVVVVAKRGDRVFHVQPGALLQAGDALRLEVTCGRPNRVVVALHEVDTKETSLLVSAEAISEKRTLLADSFILDDHVGHEELWVVCATDPALASRMGADMLRGVRPANSALVRLEKGPSSR